MYARILVGIDGSMRGELPVAPELALDLARIAATRRAESEALLAAAGDVARAAGVAAEARLVEIATPTQQHAAALAEEAASWPADLVVLGARGRRGVERLLLGSMADGVARRSSIPVLLVH